MSRREIGNVVLSKLSLIAESEYPGHAQDVTQKSVETWKQQDNKISPL